MEIYINGNEADITLQTEKTLGDFLQALQEDCEKHNATIVSVTIDDKNIEADALDLIFKNQISDTKKIEIDTVAENDIIKTLTMIGEKTKTVCNKLLEVPVLQQGGKEKETALIVEQFANTFDLICKTSSLCVFFPERFQNFRPDDKNLNDFFADFSPILQDFENALTDKDSVLLGDIAEYELVPRLEAFIAALEKIKD